MKYKLMIGICMLILLSGCSNDELTNDVAVSSCKIGCLKMGMITIESGLIDNPDLVLVNKDKCFNYCIKELGLEK